MKNLNKKAFTLIELLAVIVILGILLMTAIPAVTKNIAKSRRNTYWQNAKSYIKASATPFLAGEYVKSTDSTICTPPAPGQAVVIALKDVEVEQGDISKSSFGSPYSTGKCAPMIVITNEGIAATGATEQKDKLVWYFMGTDQDGNGIDKFTSEANLNLGAVKTGINITTCPATTSSNGTTVSYIKINNVEYKTVPSGSQKLLTQCQLP